MHHPKCLWLLYNIEKAYRPTRENYKCLSNIKGHVNIIVNIWYCISCHATQRETAHDFLHMYSCDLCITDYCFDLQRWFRNTRRRHLRMERRLSGSDVTSL